MRFGCCFIVRLEKVKKAFLAVTRRCIKREVPKQKTFARKKMGQRLVMAEPLKIQRVGEQQL